MSRILQSGKIQMLAAALMGALVTALVIMPFTVIAAGNNPPPEPSNGNPQVLQRLDEIQDDFTDQIAALQSQIGELTDRVGQPEDPPNPDLPDANLSAQIASIYAHANPDPFEVTLQTCLALGGEAGMSGSIGAEATGTIEGSLGIDAYGNGASVEATGTLEGSLGGSLSGSLGISTTACYQGVRVGFDGEHTEGQVNLIAAYNTAAGGLQGGLVDTIAAIDLGVDQLELAVAAIEALATDDNFDLTNPGNLLSNSGPLADLLEQLPFAGQLELEFDDVLTAIEDPCELPIMRDFGQEATVICAAIDRTLETLVTQIGAVVVHVEQLICDFSTWAGTDCKSQAAASVERKNEVVRQVSTIATGVYIEPPTVDWSTVAAPVPTTDEGFLTRGTGQTTKGKALAD